MPTYQQVLNAIHAYVDYSRTRQAPYNAQTYNLDRMRALCAQIGQPQNSYPALHVAGSKGKGSTAAMTAAILQAAGHRTGLYTSPHLHTFRERIRVNGELISRDELTALWEQLHPHVLTLPGTTTFEIITALAFMYFQQVEVDWAVLEVGLGGRLDATNVVHPRACAITPLSFEHTDLLGDTLSLIAFEKAGIIKPGVPVVVSEQAPEAMTVIEQVAAETGADLIRIGKDWRWQTLEATDHGLRLDIAGPDMHLADVFVPLTGLHQAGNATVAVALVDTARRAGLSVADEDIRTGLAAARWPGRLEVLGRRPLLLLDSAHNRQSAELLAGSLGLFPHRKCILIFGASSDKDIHGMLEVLAPSADVLIVTRSNHPRATHPDLLAELAVQIAPDAPLHVVTEPLDALNLALELANPEDLILITGSIFIVGNIREAWFSLHPHKFGSADWVRQAEPIDGQITPMLHEPPQAARS